ncbi:Tn3 family transposase [Streptomyces sp. NPDC002730]|uniref:Tn3 family transposase n=1 Tax=Streptomyces sp. NPDC002730 TaxID=3364662 RepID=UPI0036A5D08D
MYRWASCPLGRLCPRTGCRGRSAPINPVLSRFTRAAAHPAYQAMLEIGRAQRTVFVARNLRDRALQREIEEGRVRYAAQTGAPGSGGIRPR